MAFNPSFTTSQTLGYPEYADFLDTSTGTDGAIVARRIYVQKSDGTYAVPEGTTTDYIVWALADISASFKIILKKDIAAIVTVQWIDSNGDMLYESQIVTGYKLFSETFDYNTTYAMSGNPVLINDNGYFNEKQQLRVAIDNGDQAINFAGDIYAAQQSYNRATSIRNNAQYLFNING